jgi:4-hydroxyphenylpyruvate dioxygenase-like putative hemolysin
MKRGRKRNALEAVAEDGPEAAGMAVDAEVTAVVVEGAEEEAAAAAEIEAGAEIVEIEAIAGSSRILCGFVFSFF